jgi:hypothetical protein
MCLVKPELFELQLHQLDQLHHLPSPPTPLADMPRIFSKRRIGDDISEYSVEMPDMIGMDDAPDNEIN